MFSLATVGAVGFALSVVSIPLALDLVPRNHVYGRAMASTATVAGLAGIVVQGWREANRMARDERA